MSIVISHKRSSTPFATGSSQIISSSHAAVAFSGIEIQTGGAKSVIVMTWENSEVFPEGSERLYA